MPISYAELIARRVPLSVGEAVALVSAAAQSHGRSPLGTGLRPEQIVLHGNGTVTVTAAEDAPADDPVRAMAALLYTFLRLDDHTRPPHSEIPGPLMLMLARVRGDIDLPAPSFGAFRDVLARVSGPDAVILAAVYARALAPAPAPGAAAVRPAAVPAAAQAPLRPVAVPAATPAPHRAVPVPAAAPTAPRPGAVPAAAPAPLRPVSVPAAAPAAAQPGVVPAPAPPALRPVVVPAPAPAALHPVPVPASVTAMAADEPARGWLHGWIPLATAFAAGCAVALTFIIVMDWTTASKAVATAVTSSRTVAPPVRTPAPGVSEASGSPVSPPNAAVSTGQGSAVATASPSGGPGHAPSPSSGAGDAADAAPTPLIARTLATDAFSPSFAQDGELVFHLGRTNGRLMKASVARNGAVSVTPLVEDASSNFHGVMSPDSTHLAFDSNRDGTRGVYVAAADGTAARRVSGEGFATTPSWSPDGTRLAFVKSEPAHPRVWNVWIVDLETNRLTRVSHHRVGQAWRPSWFPDGTRLVYSVEDALIVSDLVHQTSRAIPSPARGHVVRTPAVSPDGRRVVFQVFGDGVWLFDLDRGTMHRVLADRTAEEFAWSPDGKRIAFHARHVGRWSLWQLWL
jgi:WD40 repeat protein